MNYAINLSFGKKISILSLADSPCCIFRTHTQPISYFQVIIGYQTSAFQWSQKRKWVSFTPFPFITWLSYHSNFCSFYDLFDRRDFCLMQNVQCDLAWTNKALNKDCCIFCTVCSALASALWWNSRERAEDAPILTIWSELLLTCNSSFYFVSYLWATDQILYQGTGCL